MTALRNFEPTVRWSNPDGTLTERAKGYLRNLFDFTGATTGEIPVGALGGDGVSGTLFYSAAGVFDIPDYPVGADPTGAVGPTATVGTALTFMRSDAAPALNLTVAYTFTNSLAADSLTAVNGFGCNSKAAQTEVSVNAAVAGTAGGAYTGTEQTMISDLQALVNQLRAALVANGICV
jgi:hypothetical protein